MARNTTADARIALRLPAIMKTRFEAAAEVAGHSSLSDFVLTTLQTKSAEILEREVSLVLTTRDYDQLVTYLEESNSPSDKTLQFFKAYGKNFIPKTEGERTEDPF